MSCNPCNPCCDDQVVENIPGPQGNAGDDGANGTDGQNAFTFTTAQFIMPDDDPAADVTVDVENSDWMSPTQVLYIQGSGYMEVQSIPDSTSVILQNLGYPGNTAVGNPVTSAKKVSPAGLQGPAGADGASGAPDDATYILAVPDLAALPNSQSLDTKGSGLVEFDDGTNTVDIRPIGVASGDVAPNVGALTTGEVLFAAAAGIQTVDDATARTNLGLGTAAVGTIGVANGNVVIVNDAAGLTNAQAVFATASGIESLTNAAARSSLGIDRTLQDILIYEHQGAVAAFNNGSWQTVPLTTEVVDTGTHGSIAASIITLAAGTYRARWRVCGYGVDDFQSRLFNVDLASVIAYGQATRSAGADDCQENSLGETRFTIGIATQISLQAQCETSNGTDGFGTANAFGGTQVFSGITLEREVG